VILILIYNWLMRHLFVWDFILNNIILLLFNIKKTYKKIIFFFF
jgi:hypothetical protein